MQTIDTYLLNMNKSSTLPGTLALETEHEVQLVYELFNNLRFVDLKVLLSMSDSKTWELLSAIDMVCRELEEDGYEPSGSKMNDYF